jgi:hypothetical protein
LIAPEFPVQAGVCQAFDTGRGVRAVQAAAGTNRMDQQAGIAKAQVRLIFVGHASLG